MFIKINKNLLDKSLIKAGIKQKVQATEVVELFNRFVIDNNTDNSKPSVNDSGDYSSFSYFDIGDSSTSTMGDKFIKKTISLGFKYQLNPTTAINSSAAIILESRGDDVYSWDRELSSSNKWKANDLSKFSNRGFELSISMDRDL